MSNPTSSFGWQMPTSSDLVTDLPADFEVFGQAVDTTLADLKGGTTGQVLSKASNTDMDFTWVAQDDSNAIQNAIVDAKGDLIAATAADTPARLAVGTNGQILTADSTAATGLAWTTPSSSISNAFFAGKNKIINGDFGVWQRGTSISLTNNTTAYTTDRWYVYTSFSAGSSTLARQTFTPGTAPVTGYEGTYFARYTAGSTATYFEFGQRVEDVRIFANNTATLSFWAKASANTTVSSTLLQNFGSGGSSQVSVTGASHSVTTSWTRFTATVSIPSISGKTVGTSSYLAYTLAASSLTGSQTIDIWGVQLEAGSTATDFQTATGSVQGELAACQRYYYLSNTGSTFTQPWLGYFTTSSKFIFNVYFPATMRTTPTLVTTSGADYYYLYQNGGAQYFDSVALESASTAGAKVYNTDTVSGSVGQTWDVGTSNASSLVAFSAEL